MLSRSLKIYSAHRIILIFHTLLRMLNDKRTTILYRFSSAHKLSYFYPCLPIYINTISTRLQHAKARNGQLKINIETQGRRENEGYWGTRDLVSGCSRYPKLFTLPKYLGRPFDRLQRLVMGFRVVKDQIYYFTTPPSPPTRPTTIFAPFSSDLGQPSLRGAPRIFTISFRCQTFQLTNTGTGNNESADPNFCTFTIVPALKRGGNGSESCFFAARFLLSRPFNPFPSNKQTAGNLYIYGKFKCK